jgi:predicted DNA-binding WGR domain protein
MRMKKIKESQTPVVAPFKLGFKVVKRENVIISEDEVYMTCINVQEKHNKFYKLKVHPHTGIVNRWVVNHVYGAIGSARPTGNSDKVFNNEFEARDYFRKKVKTQLKKGYIISFKK